MDFLEELKKDRKNIIHHYERIERTEKRITGKRKDVIITCFVNKYLFDISYNFEVSSEILLDEAICEDLGDKLQAILDEEWGKANTHLSYGESDSEWEKIINNQTDFICNDFEISLVAHVKDAKIDYELFIDTINKCTEFLITNGAMSR